jgi:hypothetical protein
MRLTVLVLIFLSFLAMEISGQSKYVGYRFKPVLPNHILPNGLKDLGGSVIGDTHAKPLFGIGLVSKGTTQMLWLEKATVQNSSGVQEWEIRDVLTFLNFGKNQDLLFGTESCTRDKRSDDLLVVFVDFIPRKKQYRVRKAWRVNLAHQKFISFSTKRVKCQYYEP